MTLSHLLLSPPGHQYSSPSQLEMCLLFAWDNRTSQKVSLSSCSQIYQPNHTYCLPSHSADTALLQLLCPAWVPQKQTLRWRFGWNSLLKCSQEEPVTGLGKQNKKGGKPNKHADSDEIPWTVAVVWSWRTLGRHLHLGFVLLEGQKLDFPSPALTSHWPRTARVLQ